MKFVLPIVDDIEMDDLVEPLSEPDRHFPIWEDFLASDTDVQEKVKKCNFASNLKAFRKQTKRTQEELAIEVGISRRSLQDMEAGRTGISSDVLVRLYARYGLDLHSFLTGTSVPSRKKMKERFARKAIDATVLLLDLFRHADTTEVKEWAIFLAAKGSPDDPVTVQDVMEEMPENI